jgi:hypothetical protein
LPHSIWGYRVQTHYITAIECYWGWGGSFISYLFIYR